MDVLNDDIITEILSFAKYEEIEQYAFLNKKFHRLCNSDDLWNKMIAHTFPFYPDDLSDAKRTYYKLNHFIDKYTLDIIGSFLSLRSKSVSLSKCYGYIFRVLVEYISGNDYEIEIEDQEEQKRYHNELIIVTLNVIFLYLSVPTIISDGDLKEIYPLESFFSFNNFIIKNSKQLAEILYNMIMDYIDLF